MNKQKKTKSYSTGSIGTVAASFDVDGDDKLFQETFEDSQNALQNARENSQSKEELWKELENYLEIIKTKRDSEGNRLVSIPSNFDVVSQAMTRADLESSSDVSNNNNQWSLHLLSQGFGDLFEDGRYKEALRKDSSSKEMKMQKGLAEIHLLDSRLKSVSTTALQLNKSLLATISVDDGSSPRGIGMGRVDSTFLTRSKLDSSRSKENSRSNTPRSTFEEDKEEGSGDNSFDRNKNEEEINESVTGNNDVVGQITSSSSDALRSKRTGSKLSYDEQLRVEALLHDDFESLLDVNPLAFYYEKIATLDKKISEYGHFNPLNFESSSDNLALALFKENHILTRHQQLPCSDNSSSVLDGQQQTDYLQEQRKERALKGYEEKIDKLLSYVKDNDKEGINIRGLLGVSSNKDGGKSSGTNTVGNKSKSKELRSGSMLSVPALEDVKPNRIVTSEDIQQLIHEAMLLTNNDDDDQPVKPMDSYHIDRLLATHKGDCDRLLEAKRRMARGENVDNLILRSPGPNANQELKSTEDVNGDVPKKIKMVLSKQSFNNREPRKPSKSKVVDSYPSNRSSMDASRFAGKAKKHTKPHVSFDIEYNNHDNDDVDFNDNLNTYRPDFLDDKDREFIGYGDHDDHSDGNDDEFLIESVISDEEIMEFPSPRMPSANIWAQPTRKLLSKPNMQLEVATLERLLEKTEALRLPPVNGAESLTTKPVRALLKARKYDSHHSIDSSSIDQSLIFRNRPHSNG